MCAFNEADVLKGSLEALVRDGVQVYVLDDWSTDSSYEIAAAMLGRGVIGLERCPPDRPSSDFRWMDVQERVADLALSLSADWFVHLDPDERRRPPWASLGLRDGLYEVDRSGFNCVDHTTVNFQPVDDAFPFGSDCEAYFRWFEFGRRPGSFLQQKAWKNLGLRVERAESGGHEIRFPGRRVYPFKFLLKHYPIRSQAHGERKVFGERMPRWSLAERSRGQHVHYDHLTRGHTFLRTPADLIEFRAADFNRRYLVERLSGVGLPRDLPQHEQDAREDDGDAEHA